MAAWVLRRSLRACRASRGCGRSAGRRRCRARRAPPDRDARSASSLSAAARLNPSAYTCTTAASSTRSSRYLRSGGAAVDGGRVAAALEPSDSPAQAALPIIHMIAMILFTRSLGPSDLSSCVFADLLSQFQLSSFQLIDLFQVSRDVRRPVHLGSESSARAPRRRPARRAR